MTAGWVALISLLAFLLGSVPAAGATHFWRTSDIAELTSSPTPTEASVNIPPHSCPESQAGDGTALSAGLGSDRASTTTVSFGQEATLSGYVSSPGGFGTAGASVCVYSSVVTSEITELIGVAVTNASGYYEFPIPAGPSRDLTAVYSSAGDQLSAWALLQVHATATLNLSQNPAQNGHLDYFSGHIPPPDNDGVIVVMQVRSGRGWLTFSRYSTRNGGRYLMRHHFTHTLSATTYTLRAQVAGAPGYPYLQGASAPRLLRVVP